MHLSDVRFILRYDCLQFRFKLIFIKCKNCFFFISNHIARDHSQQTCLSKLVFDGQRMCHFISLQFYVDSPLWNLVDDPDL